MRGWFALPGTSKETVGVWGTDIASAAVEKAVALFKGEGLVTTTAAARVTAGAVDLTAIATEGEDS